MIGSRGSFSRRLFAIGLLFGLVAVVQAQHDKKSSPPPKPAQHASASHNTPQHNTNSRPATTHTPTNTRPNTNAGNRMNGGAGNRTTNGGNLHTGTGNVRTNGGNLHTGGGNMHTGTNRGPNGGPANRTNTRAATGVNRPLAGRQVSLRGGGTASIRPNGQIRSINRNGMQINRGLNGSRTIVGMHNGARVVNTGRNGGYVQRAYVTRGGRTYVSRTVVVNHVVYSRVYRSYAWGGHYYYAYHPAFFWHAGFYGWAYNPWPAPVYWGWGWGGAPWYGFYGGYFAPYPVYPSAAFWLTDYLISAELQAAYQARAANAAAAASDNSGGGDQQQQQAQDNGGDQSAGNSGGSVALTPEVKEAIAEEVKAQIAAQQGQAQQGSSDSGQQGDTSQQASSGGNAAPADQVPAALDPNIKMFIVSSDLTVASNGQECQLTEGDVIKRTSETPDDDRKVTATVSSSKKNDCATGQEIAVGVDDLQEMHNHFEEQLDSGMKELSSKQGTGGLPKAPDPTSQPSDVPPPPPDNSAAKTLEDQQQAADQTEAQVVKEAFNQGS